MVLLRGWVGWLEFGVEFDQEALAWLTDGAEVLISVGGHSVLADGAAWGFGLEDLGHDVFTR